MRIQKSLAVLAAVIISGFTSMAVLPARAMAASDPFAICRQRGYDNYSTHYQKCVNVQYSYSGSLADDHRSKARAFGPKFQADIKTTCYQQSRMNYTFYSQTLGKNWKSGSITDNTTNPSQRTTRLYSDAAQTLKMHFTSDNCTYSVIVYQ